VLSVGVAVGAGRSAMALGIEEAHGRHHRLAIGHRDRELKEKFGDTHPHEIA
jgi:hypothetical protein